MDSGASNDLQQATRDAYVAIAHYGMDKEVGYININGVIDAQRKSAANQDTEHYYEKIDAALERWMSEGQQRVTDLVNEHWSTIEKLSNILLQKEIIYADELDKIVAG
jgi:cell division protease FtsH